MFKQHKTIIENFLEIPLGSLSNSIDHTDDFYSIKISDEVFFISCFDHANASSNEEIPFKNHFSFFSEDTNNLDDTNNKEHIYLFFENQNYMQLQKNDSNIDLSRNNSLTEPSDIRNIYDISRQLYKYFIIGFTTEQINQISNCESCTEDTENIHYNVYYLNDNFKKISTSSFSFNYLFKLGLFKEDFFTVFKIQTSL